MSTLERLERVLPVPQSPIEAGSPERWQSVESAIGIELPPDYKEFINTYGSGLIGRFLYFWNPFAQKTYMNFMLQFTEYMSLVTSEFESLLTHPFYPKSRGLLPFGRTINGDTLFWVTSNAPTEWKLFILDARSTDCEEYDETIVDFIADLLENKIHGELISSDLVNFNELFSQEI